ncbi:hypothetical protein [Natronobiforma cellulositropha]|uniref:hypothetical protein n=1 Tax=Natronobiforma cellulositropha TaxID=1679076 RepID=UPI0021D5AABE|nr:hypothetical protein [Natronobiforma cellulositropha]
MNRRQVLAAVGVGTAALAGCLSDGPRSSDPPSNETDAAPSLDALSNECPYTEASPPSTLTENAVRAFVEASEADYAMEHQSVSGLQHTGVAVETVHIADGVARVDAELFLTDGGISGEATVYSSADYVHFHLGWEPVKSPRGIGY